METGARRGVIDSKKDKALNSIPALKNCLSYTMTSWRVKTTNCHLDKTITVLGKDFDAITIPENTSFKTLKDLDDFLLLDESIYIKAGYRKMVVKEGFFQGWRNACWLYPSTILTTLEKILEHPEMIGNDPDDIAEIEITIILSIGIY